MFNEHVCGTCDVCKPKETISSTFCLYGELQLNSNCSIFICKVRTLNYSKWK